MRSCSRRGKASITLTRAGKIILRELISPAGHPASTGSRADRCRSTRGLLTLCGYASTEAIFRRTRRTERRVLAVHKESATQSWEKWPCPEGLALQWSHTALRIAYLEQQPNCALRALPGSTGEPTLGIRIVLTGPKLWNCSTPRVCRPAIPWGCSRTGAAAGGGGQGHIHHTGEATHTAAGRRAETAGGGGYIYR